MAKFIRIILCFFLLLFWRCDLLESNQERRDKDSDNNFYSSHKSGDLYRIPLIKPLEVYNTGYLKEPWFFDIPYKNNSLGKDQIHVNQVGVDIRDSIIVLYSESIAIPALSKISELWLVIKLKEEKEFSFTDIEEYKNKMNLIGSDIELKDCEVVYNEFKQTGILKW